MNTSLRHLFHPLLFFQSFLVTNILLYCRIYRLYSQNSYNTVIPIRNTLHYILFF